MTFWPAWPSLLAPAKHMPSGAHKQDQQLGYLGHELYAGMREQPHRFHEGAE